MRAFIRYILILTGLFLMYISTSRQAMQYISEKRNGSDKWWGISQNDHGDLVRMSSLDIAKFCVKQDYKYRHPAKYISGAALYLMGDSYSWEFTDSCFVTGADFHFGPGPANNYSPLVYRLDRAKKNILVIEIAERYMREHFCNFIIYDGLHDSAYKKGACILNPTFYKVCCATVLPYADAGMFFNKNINQNIEYNTFRYNFLLPLFECKAWINYYFFHRASGDVAISKDKTFLLWQETTTGTTTRNAYSKLTVSQLSLLACNLNAIYDHYKADGFDEVYLSIIPNTTTLIDTEGYNNLIPLLQQYPGLRMKTIDIYTVFKQNPREYLLRGDTHWNNAGAQLWLDIVNKLLQQQVAEE